MSTIGKPISTPVSQTDLTPFSTPGMYSFGTVPPTILASNSLPLPVSFGSSLQLDARELAGAAGLLLVRVVDVGRAARASRDRPPAARRRWPRRRTVRSQDVDLDVEMQLAHALEDGLARLLVDRDAERGILERQRVQRHRHLLLVGLGLRLDLHLDDGVRGTPSSRAAPACSDRTASRRCACP